MDKNILLYIILSIGLIICTITDLKSREIHVPVIIAELLLISCFHIWHQSFSFVSVIGAIIICVFFAAISFFSGGQIGLGDAFLFAVTGFGLGLMENIFIIMLTFIFTFCAALFLVFIKHKSRYCSIPLSPFVLSAFIIYLVRIYFPV